MDRFLLMTCFARAVETGSFSAAGRDLGLGQPNVSRHVAALEEHLHTRLLNRSTRKLVLTPEGERYYAEVRRILDAVGESEMSLRDNVQPSGLLRVACPTALSHQYVMPLVPEFLRRFPGLELDLQINGRFVNLLDEGAELAIRIGHLENSALRARRIGSFKRVCVASKDYLAERGIPTVPDDLRQHDCVLYTLLASGASWRFKEVDVPVTGRIRVNSPEAAREAVSAGLGIGQGPEWLFEQGLNAGHLQIVLSAFSGPAVPMHIMYAANRLVARRAIVFMDFIAEAFAKIPQLNAPSCSQR
ncbi:LysR family transcriptional regulator [Xanthomonas hortorum]|uniref:HTH-type transcriptional regulator DmlR n=3 Tax=Xanthomonas hortorum TaxID=56454 RepID=A0A6V7B895_9XANT|nr:LysR family transcriptional regulator [Xanthomonas hortorum]MCE4355381.1 LysR family transcriptional regulator [Xanthomonas hortorum pv. pelargonii]MCM5523968.1 LysR family transcriptional regulator [Xanthomonas hortorum pv. pelargonii]MCM5536213.1 LysR family transcriptional regulator [Xanthomonas hortorum pv. pelargonii]MCM5540383.1 LysR family transcriptional regulator [Xanthomonas hortorum pv. pelargonii]MCM5561829.1 LysR family transcriptional regulator [Xanthomonas hortorum pv. pelarg